MFHSAITESTAAPGEETTAVPPGKTTNNMEKEMKRLLNENFMSIEFLAFVLDVFLSVLKWSIRFTL